MPNILWFQLLKWEDLLFFVLHHCKENISRVWTFTRTNRDILVSSPWALGSCDAFFFSQSIMKIIISCSHYILISSPVILLCNWWVMTRAQFLCLYQQPFSLHSGKSSCGGKMASLLLWRAKQHVTTGMLHLVSATCSKIKQHSPNSKNMTHNRIKQALRCLCTSKTGWA